MSTSLFINGVFEDTLKEIENTQHDHPGKPYYLQPYSPYRIKLLAESHPTTENPITVYLSLTDSLNCISFRANIVGWHDKRELDPATLKRLNQHIEEFQPSEKDIYPKAHDDGKPCVNLISILDLTRLKAAIDENSGTTSEAREEHQFPISCLIKTRDNKPLKNRTRAGGWSAVRKQTLPK